MWALLFAFIDESYTNTHYYQAAIVIREQNLHRLEDLKSEVIEYVKGFGVENLIELHAHSLMTSRDGWEALENKARARISIFKKIQSLISDLPARVFIEGVDVPQLHIRYKYPDSPHTVTLRHLLEDIQSFAHSMDEQVTIFCDEIGDAKVHQRHFEYYKSTNTSGYKPSSLHNLDSLSFVKSHEHPGIQVVDQIVYLYRRMDSHTETDSRTRDAVLQMWETLNPIVVKHRRWTP